MNNLETFNHPIFGNLSVLIINGIEWFGANEVASSLEYAKPYKAVTDHCDTEGVLSWVVPTNGGNQQKKFISLGNVSRLIVAASKQSKNLEIQQKAKRYDRWIFDEVIPTVHKHGAYMTQQTLEKALTNPDFLIDLATRLKEEQGRRLDAEQKVQDQKPKVLFAEAVETSKSSILIGELAKILKQNGVSIGQKRLFDWLRDNGYLIKRLGDEYNNPTQKSMELRLFEIKKSTINNPDGSVRVTKTPKVTGKGQVYFINKFLYGKEMKRI